METSAEDAAPRELPIVGGHLALDFANTVDDPLGPARHDHASTYADLLRWSTRVGSIDEGQAAALLRAAGRRPREAEVTLTSAHELRDALNEVFVALVRGEHELPASWATLRDRAADAQQVARFERRGDGPGRWTWPDSADLRLPLHPVASAARDLLVSDQLMRVKQCRRCPWLFVDTSKNHSRRWCDMDDCGRAEKIERYVARRAARRRSG